MPESPVLIEKKDHVARITLNRPSTGNILDLQTAQDFADACRDTAGDAEVYVVVITGVGGVFCNGSELEAALQDGAKIAPGEPPGVKIRIADTVAAIEKPVIAAINGDALGQGLEIALACDMRVAAAGAHFGFTNVALGILPADGGTQRLPRIIGRGKALEMLFTAEILSAEEAQAIGLVAKVVHIGSLAAEVDAIARTMAGKAPLALRYIKEAVNKGMDLTLEQGLRLEADLYFLLHTTEDRTEGIRAFQQKRPPQFKGR